MKKGLLIIAGVVFQLGLFAQFTPVEWTDGTDFKQGFTFDTENTNTKTAASNTAAGKANAWVSHSIALEGDGEIRWTVTDIMDYQIGFSSEPHLTTVEGGYYDGFWNEYGTMQFAIERYSTYSTYQEGTEVTSGSFGAVITGDVVTIEKVGATVRVLVNGIEPPTAQSWTTAPSTVYLEMTADAQGTIIPFVESSFAASNGGGGETPGAPAENTVTSDQTYIGQPLLDEAGNVIPIPESAVVQVDYVGENGERKGMLMPRMTTTERNTKITNPAEGLMVYDTDLRKVHMYNTATSSWVATADGNDVNTLTTGLGNLQTELTLTGSRADALEQRDAIQDEELTDLKTSRGIHDAVLTNGGTVPDEWCSYTWNSASCTNGVGNTAGSGVPVTISTDDESRPGFYVEHRGDGDVIVARTKTTGNAFIVKKEDESTPFKIDANGNINTSSSMISSGSIDFNTTQSSDKYFMTMSKNSIQKLGITSGGEIWAQEIKVNLNEPSAYPDYVFEDNYELMSLNDFKEFIEKEGHLPNIPTREEATKNGVDLYEMNRLLLEKVEEMSLYIIELNSRLEKLEK